tara:strand:- start:708 stop:1160 length:453 start_codon:yes stop_codon:yes gene_type:complete
MEKTTKKSLLFLAAAAVTVLNFQSCGKYEDGPGFSLRSKKARITGEWELVKINGQSPTQYSGFDTYEEKWELESDGDLSVTTNYSFSTYYGYSYSGSYTQTGEWEFSSDKEDLEITIDGSKTELEILQLKNNESKFKTKSSPMIEYEFEK